MKKEQGYPSYVELSDWRIIPEEKSYRIRIDLIEKKLTVSTDILKGMFLKEDTYEIKTSEIAELMVILKPERIKGFLSLSEEELKKQVTGCRDSWYLHVSYNFPEKKLDRSYQIIYENNPAEELMQWLSRHFRGKIEELKYFEW